MDDMARVTVGVKGLGYESAERIQIAPGGVQCLAVTNTGTEILRFIKCELILSARMKCSMQAL